MSCNEPEFCRINVDFKEFKSNNLSFHFMIPANPSSPDAGVATEKNIPSKLFSFIKQLRSAT